MKISKLVTVYNHSDIDETRPLRVGLTTYLEEDGEFQRIAHENLSLSKQEALEVIKLLSEELDNLAE